MSPEGQKPSELNLPTVAAIIGGIYLLSNFACSKKVRQEVKRRDGYKSVWSGKTENIEVSHISHNRDLPNYDTAENARSLTTAEHMWDHINRHGTDQLGLTEAQNDWAIMAIWKRFWGIDKKE